MPAGASPSLMELAQRSDPGGTGSSAVACGVMAWLLTRVRCIYLTGFRQAALFRPIQPPLPDRRPARHRESPRSATLQGVLLGCACARPAILRGCAPSRLSERDRQ